jgi:hypothetical protein
MKLNLKIPQLAGTGSSLLFLETAALALSREALKIVLKTKCNFC